MRIFGREKKEEKPKEVQSPVEIKKEEPLIVEPLKEEELKKTLGSGVYQRVFTGLLYSDPVKEASVDYFNIPEAKRAKLDKEKFVPWLLQVPNISGKVFIENKELIISYLSEKFEIDFGKYNLQEQLNIIGGIAEVLRLTSRNRLYETGNFGICRDKHLYNSPGT